MFKEEKYNLQNFCEHLEDYPFLLLNYRCPSLQVYVNLSLYLNKIVCNGAVLFLKVVAQGQIWT